MFRRFGSCLAASLLFTLTAASAEELPDGDRLVLGYAEKVRIEPAEMTVRGRLDTGATTTSVNATAIEPFERNGEPWVRFTVLDSENRKVRLARRVERIARIRSAAGKEQRYVVKMALCVGTVQRRIEVNLSDRSDMLYPLLVGRNFLADTVLVDASARYLQDPACDRKPTADAKPGGTG